MLSIQCFQYNGRMPCSDSHYQFSSSPLRIIQLEQLAVTPAALKSRGEALGNAVAPHLTTAYSISLSKDKAHQY